MLERMFSKRDDFKNLSDVMDKWTHDEMNVKDAFFRLANRFSKKDQAVLSFVLYLLCRDQASATLFGPESEQKMG